MTLPTSSDIPRIAEGVENFVKWLKSHGAEVLDAQGIAVDEHEPKRERSQVWCDVHENDSCKCSESYIVPERSDPTGRDAERLAGDWLSKQQQAFRFLLLTLYTNAADAVDLMGGVVGRIDPPRHKRDELSRQSEASCVERYCEDPASSKCAGRCEPCYRWRRRYAGFHGGELPGNVPESVIAHRVALRENRKVFVSGPREGEVA